MSKKTKLELTWIGKEHRHRLEPRILLEEADKSHHAAHQVTDRDLFDNRLIHGDNLLAVKALEQDFVSKVKCIFIDSPYNTGSAFEHYDDGVEHSTWLCMMRNRLEIIKRLLSADGSLWLTLDDQTPALPDARPHSHRPRCAGRESNFLATSSSNIPLPKPSLAVRIFPW